MALLLGPDEPAAFEVVHPSGVSPFVFTCDHAGRRLPRALGDLGVPTGELVRHIAWDIGIAEVGNRLAAKLDAFLITQTYSRLVIDVNRAPGSPQSIVTLSEHTRVVGNEGLGAEAAAQRAREIFHPYHDRIREELDARASARRPTILVTLHSFTPVFKGTARAWHAGVLYHRDARLGRVLLALLRAEPGLVVGDNEPYAVSETSDYGLLVHGEMRGLLNVELEIRQDLIADADGQAAWAARLARLLPRAAELAAGAS